MAYKAERVVGQAGALPVAHSLRSRARPGQKRSSTIAG